MSTTISSLLFTPMKTALLSGAIVCLANASAQNPAPPPAPASAPPASSPPASAPAPLPSLATQRYDVEQTVVVSDIPRNARNLRLWVSIPDNGLGQRILDFAVRSAPGPWQIVRDRDRGQRFLYTEVTKPKAGELSTTVRFVVDRAASFQTLDPAAAAPLPADQRPLFAEELRLNSPHMEVTEVIRKKVRELCGEETNPVLVSRKLLDHVADIADHYSKNPNVPNCGIGDAGSCLEKGGGCCTDLHSLFIALARGAGIPARLQMGYRLNPKNVGVEADPGYRCWAEYFIGGYGWIPSDIVEADAGDVAGRTRWFSGLTERRIHLNEGRDFNLPFKKNAAPVNHMSIGYAEIDGKPVRVLPEGEKKPQIARKVKYSEPLPPQSGPLVSIPVGR